MGCGPIGGSPMMFDNYGGYGGYNAPPAPYYAPRPQMPVAQPRLPARPPASAQPQTAAVPAKPPVVQSTKVAVPTPEQLGIRFDDPPVVVPSPHDLGIDLE